MEDTRVRAQLRSRTARLDVLVVDDHRYFRESLISFLGEYSNVNVAGTAGNGREAVDMAGQLKPDLVIMDIQMPEMDGVQACREIKKSSPETRVLLYTMHSPEAYGDEALKGADRFVPKESLFDELSELIANAFCCIRK